MKIRILCFTLVGVLSSTVHGQSDTARIAGTVTDPTSSVVPHAMITVKNEKTGQLRKVTSNDQGLYLVTELGPSIYSVTAEVTGMAPAQYAGVTLQVGQERTLNIAVQPATVSTEVQVSGGDLAVIDTSSAAIGGNVSAGSRGAPDQWPADFAALSDDAWGSQFRAGNFR
jgi:hypothetical protein